MTKNSEEAERAALRARELDPLNANIHRILGFVYYASRRFDESIAAVQRAISINPELSDAHGRIAISELQLGNLEKAKAAADLEQRRLFGLPYRAIILDRMDQKDEARKEYEALKQAYGDAGLYQQAQVLAQWGALGEAMETLKRAEAKGDSGLTYLYVDPLLDPLRDNSEFAALLRRLGFTA